MSPMAAGEHGVLVCPGLGDVGGLKFGNKVEETVRHRAIGEGQRQGDAGWGGGGVEFIKNGWQPGMNE